jgi:CRP/FNR family transcriptional regulator, dissimilatory nitrate respiration regulator
VNSELASLQYAAIASSLRLCTLFQDLSPEELQRVAETCSLKSLHKGEYLFREGEKAMGFYIVRTGAVNVHRIRPDGREQVICIFRPTECFAEVTLTTFQVYPANAMALEPSQVILVRKREFRELIHTAPELALRMLTSMSFHLKHLVQLLEDQKFKQIETRLASYLLRQAGEPQPGEPPVVVLDVSKRVLANQLGVTSETFSRTLARFREEGLIEVKRQEIRLINASGLEAYLQAG